MMNNKRPRYPISGWINLHKPVGVTSASVVNQVKHMLNPAKIGHAGTLDPLASGVLPLALGEATKCVSLLMDAKKTYEFDVTFGERRATDDAEGEVIATSNHIPSEKELRDLLPRFIGAIEQMPPAYSALKVDGKRAYALARAGEEVTLQPRNVTVYSIELVQFNTERSASFKAIVSKGTYIRSLGRDIAQAVGSEGYISRLHRASVGPFTDCAAISLDFLENSAHKAAPDGQRPDWLLPLSVALDDIPALSLTAIQAQSLRHGQQVMLASPQEDAPLAAALLEGQLVALTRIEANRLIPQRLMNM